MSEEQPPAERDTASKVRNSKGSFVRTVEQVAEDARAADLRSQGKTYAAIGRELGISKGTAHDRVQRAFAEILKEPAEQARAVELARLEDAHDHALAVLLREHVTVSHGKVITIHDEETGTDVPLIDDAPVLQAIDRIKALSESRRKLLGLDAPAQVEHSGGVRYEVVGIAPEDLV